MPLARRPYQPPPHQSASLFSQLLYYPTVLTALLKACPVHVCRVKLRTLGSRPELNPTHCRDLPAPALSSRRSWTSTIIWEKVASFQILSSSLRLTQTVWLHCWPSMYLCFAATVSMQHSEYNHVQCGSGKRPSGFHCFASGTGLWDNAPCSWPGRGSHLHHCWWL